MPADSLTARQWLRALERYSDRASRMLAEIIIESDDPVVAKILDKHAAEVLK